MPVPGWLAAGPFHGEAPCYCDALGVGRGLVTAARQPATAARPVALFILGMARSGTSALTRVLSLCGGALPTGLVGAMEANPRGFFESRKATYVSEAILRRHGSAGYDPTLRLQEEVAFDGKEKATCLAQIGAFLATLPAAPFVVIKDHRINAIAPMWFEAARANGFDVATVNAVRHPQEVIASVAKNAPATPELTDSLWLKYNLLAERDTREVPRVFVEYPNLLEDWRREVKRISAALAIDLDARDEGAIDEFLTPDLRRQRYDGPMIEPFGTDWNTTVYDALRAAARDEAWDGSALDRVFEAYRASEYAYRTALENFRSNFSNPLLRPSVLRVFGEIMAIAHRRKGSWA